VSLVAPPTSGRIFVTGRRVRLGDAALDGRMRLDAVARFLQDAGNEDTEDAGRGDGGGWLARRMTFEVACWPALGDELTLATWCGGLGARWAERRTRVSIGTVDGPVVAIDASALWIHVDVGTGRPVVRPDWFDGLYAEAAAGRTVSTKLVLPGPDAVGDPTSARPWPLRSTDFDGFGHVNNAIAWAAIEDELNRHGDPARLRAADVEYRGAIEPGDEVELVSTLATRAGEPRIWLTAGGEVRLAAALRWA
jgi:acyl-ACP thioesterase